MVEDELMWIIDFDETVNPFMIHNEKGGSRSIRWGDTTLAKGSERGN